jgi:hypothetical protein
VPLLGGAGEARPDAAVGVGDHDPAVLGDVDLVEVEEVAAAGAERPLHADGAALHRVVGRHVERLPARPAVVGHRDIEMPGVRRVHVGAKGARQIAVLRAEEGDRRSAGIAGDDLREGAGQHAERGADVERRAPGQAVVVAGRDLHLAVAVDIAEIDAVVGIGVDRRVGALAAGRLRDGPHRPGGAGALAHRHDLLAAASRLRHVGGAVRGNLDVAVELAADLAAVRLGIDRHRRAEGDAAVAGDGALRQQVVLRAIVDGVVVAPHPLERIAGRKGTASDRLVIDAGIHAAPLGLHPGVAVVVGIGHRAALAGELAGEGAPGLVIGEKDRVEGKKRGRDEALIAPLDGGRRSALVRSEP